MNFGTVYTNTIITNNYYNSCSSSILYNGRICIWTPGVSRKECHFRSNSFHPDGAGTNYLVPQYLIIQKLGLMNTIPALFLPNLFSAFGTFLLRQFFMSLPKELEEAALLDGCNRFQIFGKIMLPLVKAGIVSLVIFTAKFAWNDFMWPLIVNTDPSKMTLAPALSLLKGQYATNFPGRNGRCSYGSYPNGCTVLYFQKQFIEGIAQSGIKG